MILNRKYLITEFFAPRVHGAPFFSILLAVAQFLFLGAEVKEMKLLAIVFCVFLFLYSIVAKESMKAAGEYNWVDTVIDLAELLLLFGIYFFLGLTGIPPICCLGMGENQICSLQNEASRHYACFTGVYSCIVGIALLSVWYRKRIVSPTAPWNQIMIPLYFLFGVAGIAISEKGASLNAHWILAILMTIVMGVYLLKVKTSVSSK